MTEQARARPSAEQRREAVGREVTVELTSVSHLGEGVGRLGEDAEALAGMAVFVPGTLPGERASVVLDEVHRRHARARMLELVTTSDDRVTPPCPVAATCGGCDLQHVEPAAQRALKTTIVRDQLQRLGGVETPPVEPCRAVGDALGYRRHGTVHRDTGGDGTAGAARGGATGSGGVGFHARGSHDVVVVDDCPVLDDRLSAALGPAAASEADHVGLHLDDDAVALVLTPGVGPLQLPEGPRHLLATQPEADPVALRGDGVLRTTVPTADGDLVLGHDVTCFFQPSPAAAGAIVDTVLGLLGDVDGALAWDLYAGVGLLGLAMARRGAQVVAVEGHARSADWAGRNAEALELALQVENRDVRAFTREAAGLDQTGREDTGREDTGLDDTGPDDTGSDGTGPAVAEAPDVVVLDPPRTGAGTAVVEAIVRLRPADVVVVACDAGALARDVRTFADHGYTLETAVPLDTFPMTRHVEVVAHLRG